ncbi:MAG: protein kinase [Gemmataceae bacterium]
MIAFACSECGLKLQVKDEFAGRHSKCPTCKKPLVVPAPTSAVAPQEIDSESSLARAGIQGGVVLPPPQAGPPKQPAHDALKPRPRHHQRYQIEGEIARGGMGAVLRALDGDIRREVAVKYMLDEKDPRKKARFIEEAQINGQLEHPNIVPVYDLGIDARQRPFIMMKMVKGRSLKDALDWLRQQPRAAEREFSLGRLLNILVNVCNALAYAHSRGVVHRDLKPANIMLGDFGEVYLMDWGLAKVMHGGSTPADVPSDLSVTVTSSSSKVLTNREVEADLTQEGSVLGTPAYMPPEQASGQLGAVDARSDVYSLGALLYEMLTLQPPVSKEGGHLAVLMRVIDGEIIPPERRDPRRARKVPAELSAIVMKAMARNKDDRYPSVVALREDIERFQEGRSVSAKEDTRREMAWKFVKRNKGFSAGAALALVMLVFSLVFVTRSWLKSRQDHLDLTQRTEKAVPALVDAARLSAENRDFEDALTQLELAAGYLPDYARTHLVAGQVHVGRFDFERAHVAFENYLNLEADDDVEKLSRLCQHAHSDDSERLLELIALLQKQQSFGPAGVLLEKVGKLGESRRKLVPVLRQRLDAAWPGMGKHLTIDRQERIFLAIGNDWNDKVTNINPLRGMPLNALSVLGCDHVRDLSPLKDMPLTSLRLSGSHGFRDLGPLRGLPLTTLHLHGNPVRDLSPLAGMGLTQLDLGFCTEVRDLSPLKGMPLNWLSLWSCTLEDLTPLRGMPLRNLNLTNSAVRDVSPLAGLPLENISLPHAVNQGMAGLRSIKSLARINEMPASDFWRKWDRGELKQFAR